MTQKTEIDSSYIKASKTVSSLVWTLLNALDTNDSEPDALSNHDKDLLIDVLRYGTVAEVARVRKSTIEIIRKQYKDALSRLQPKVYTIEQIASLKTQLADAENKLNQQRKELIDSKAQLGMTEQLYWKQQKMMNDDQTDHENYKELYLAAKQKNEELMKIINQQKIAPLNYEEMYKTAVWDERKMRKQLTQEIEKYKAKYEKAKEELANNKKLAKDNKPKPSPSKTEIKLKSRVKSLQNLLKRYKEEGLKALLNSDITI